ncbi:MAG: S41 family peptidase, partial [Dehalococcoidia bacterium]|nr:S41 family peptidase [Dehalococcoidia bacterium]
EPEKLDDTALERGAIRGMLEALDDPYTSYLDPHGYEMELASLEGKFEGIGAYVAMREGELVILSPISDTPAEKAGLRPGDRIVEVDGEPTAGLSLNEAVLRIRGPQGTDVKLLILHEGDKEPVLLTITRGEIPLVSVGHRMEGEMGYIQIFHFTQRTAQEFKKSLASLMDDGAQGLVLDLRNNPGGLLSSVVDVADELLDEGIVLIEVDNQGQRKTWGSNSDGLATTLPTVVLVNSFSASGSEVLSGALQDRDRATIIGEVTFGKGSVNTIHRLSDNSALYLTSARWLTPLGRPIEGTGLTPDVLFESPDEEEQDQNEGEGGPDEGLERALEYLRQGKAQPATPALGAG